MIPECQHTLYNGRQCRRIPATGQRFCPAHRSRQRREDVAFDRGQDAYCDSVAAMNLSETLAALEAALVDVRPRIPRSARNKFFRAGICVGFAIERLREARELRRPQVEYKKHLESLIKFIS